MTLEQFLYVLKARLRLIFFVFTTIVSLGVVVTLLLPKEYESSTTVILDYKEMDPLASVTLSPNMMPGYMGTQLEIIQSENVALKVVGKLKLDSNPTFVEIFLEEFGGAGDIRYWLASILLKDLEVQPSKDSNVITISYSSQNPEFSALVANAFASAYIETNLELKVNPALKTLNWFKKQINELKLNASDAQQKLTNYEKEKGILFSDTRFDVETARLSQLTTALTQSEEKLFDLKTKLAAVNKKNIKDSDIDLLDDPLINQLKVQLAQLESRFAEIKQRVSKNHPDYKSTSAELVSVKLRLKKELEAVKAKLEESVKREHKRVNELKNKVENQKEKLLVLNEDKDKQEELMNEVKVAKEILSAAMARMIKTSLEAQSDQANISILDKAVPPIKPSKPIVVLNVILSILFGIVISIGLSLMFEFFNRRARTKSDVEMLTGIPVIAEIDRIRFQKKKKWFRKG